VKIKRGSTSVRRLIFIADTSKTDGSGLANLVYNSSGLVAYYFAGDLNNEVPITLATATLGTYASGGFIAVDNANMPGWYEIGIPDAALDGGNGVAIQLRGANNMAPVNIYIELDAVDYQTDAFGALRPTTAGRTLDVTATGAAGIDLGNVENPTTTLNLSGTTISTTQAVASVSGAVGSVTGAVGSVTGAVGSVTARVTANTDQWGGVTVTGMPLPTASYTTPPTVAQVVTGVYAALPADHTVSGSYGVRFILALNNNRTVQVTGSNHIAADVHEFQTDVISANAIAASAVTEIQSGLATLDNQTTINNNVLSRLASSAYTAPDNSGIAAIKVVTDRVNTGLVQDGAVWQFTVNMLENGPAGAGGGSATLQNQELILDQLDLIQNKTDLITSSGAVTSLLAGAVLEPGTIQGFPTTLKIGDSYTAANGRAIDIPIVDTDGIPLDTAGSLDFSAATVTFTVSRAKETNASRIVNGTATVINPPGTGTANAPYVRVEISSSETAKGLLGYRYTATLKFTWSGTGTDVMSFESSSDIVFDN